MKTTLNDEFVFLRKTGRAASFGSTEGRYSFFTSSPMTVKRTDVADCCGPALVFGTGGSASVHLAVSDFSTSNDCYIAVPKSGKLDDVKFVYYYLKDNIYLIEKGFRGAGLKHVSKGYLESIPIPSPEHIDRAVVNKILDKADGIRQKRDKTIAMANAFLCSAFVTTFGDPVENPHGFRYEEIANHLSNHRNGVQSGPFGSALKKNEYTEVGVPVWGVENVQRNEFVDVANLFISNEKYEQLIRYSVLPGDVLISRAGTVGRMCVVGSTVTNSIIGTNLVRLALNEKSVLPEYFVSLFTYLPHRLGALKANDKENAFTFLNPETLKRVEIPIPPMRMQAHFRLLSRSITKQVLLLKQHQSGLDDLFASISKRAFSV